MRAHCPRGTGQSPASYSFIKQRTKQRVFLENFSGFARCFVAFVALEKFKRVSATYV